MNGRRKLPKRRSLRKTCRCSWCVRVPVSTRQEQAAALGEREQRGSDLAYVDHFDECFWCRELCYGPVEICETEGCSECGGPVVVPVTVERLRVSIGERLAA